jgi:hypothetical protein
MECKRLLKWGLCPQTPGIFRFRARIPGPQERDRLTLAESWPLNRRSGRIPALPYPPFRWVQFIRGAYFHGEASEPSLAPARSTTTIQCGEMGRTTLGLSSKSVNHVAGLKCQRCPRPGRRPKRRYHLPVVSQQPTRASARFGHRARVEVSGLLAILRDQIFLFIMLLFPHDVAFTGLFSLRRLYSGLFPGRE